MADRGVGSSLNGSHKLLPVLWLGMVFPIILAEDAWERPLSVWDSVEVALENSPGLAAAKARIQAAAAVRQQARAAYWPALSIDAGYLHSNAPSVVFGKTLDQRAFDFAATNFTDPEAIDNVETGATLRYGLYEPGRGQRAKAAASHLSAERLGKSAVENQLIDAVVKAYYTVLEGDEAIRTAEASVATIEAECKDTRVRFTGGAALETDVLSLEVRLAGAREQLIRARNGRRLALSAMANLLGLPPDTPLQLSGAEWQPRSLPGTYDEGLAEALRLRPELRGLRERLQAARLSEQAARRAYLPRLDVMARGYLDAEDVDYETDNGNWLVGVMLSLDVFDGFRKQGEVARSKAVVQELTAEEKQLLRNIQLEVQQAYLRFGEAEERVRVTSSAADQAAKVLEQVRKQFQGGAATITRYLEAELDLTNARSRATTARYDQKKSMAEVGRALGFCVNCARDTLKGRRPK